MANYIPPERVQPCLLSRLIDEEPNRLAESAQNRAVPMRVYRQAVLRDLKWLFNTPARPEGDPIYDFPEASGSVLNYGLHSLSGKTVTGINLHHLEREIKQVIINFEPRIIADTLTVTANRDFKRSKRSQISFEIRAQLWAQPLPEQMLIKTEIDLETGQWDL